MRLARAVTLAAIGVGACAAEGEGTVAFTTYGEAFIEKRIPAEAVADGWSIAYTKFLVVVSDVAIAEAEGTAPVATMPAPRLFDMHRAGPKEVFTARGLPARAYGHVSWMIGPAGATTEAAEGVPAADRDRMVQGGYSLWVEGAATREGVVKRFAWGFRARTLLDRCEGPRAGRTTPGVVVTNGGTDTVELTIHGDHLFYDDLQDPEAKVRFDNLAEADADGDGEITLEELGRVELAAIPRERGAYGTGSAAGIDDLRAFVEALSRTVGHFRGEGECFAVPR